MPVISTPQPRTAFADVRPWHRPFTAATVLTAAVFLLGYAADTRWVTAADLHLDEGIAAGRNPTLTTLAVFATTLAQPAVGAAAAVLVPLLLVLRRRVGLGLRVAALIGASLALALVAKVVIAEDRPPAALAVVAADSGWGTPAATPPSRPPWPPGSSCSARPAPGAASRSLPGWPSRSWSAGAGSTSACTTCPTSSAATSP